MRPLMRVVIVDPHPGLLAGLRTLIADADGMDVVGESTDGAGALAAVRAGEIDVVVVDERVAGASTPATQALLGKLARRAAVVVVGMGDAAGYGDAHLGFGAAGYWPKFGELEALVALVRQAAGAQPPVARLRVVNGSA